MQWNAPAMARTWSISSRGVSDLHLRKRFHTNNSSVKYYPSWLPGGQFKKDATEAKAIMQQLRHMPFNMVRNEMVISLFLCHTAHNSSVLGVSGRGNSAPVIYIHASEPTTTG